MTTPLGMPFALLMGSPVSGASTPTSCRATALTPTVGRGSGATGTTYETLLMKNFSSGSCTLSSTPTTEFGKFVSSTGSVVFFRTIGPAATKISIAERGKTIVVRPGAVASVTIGIENAANYQPSQCHKADASRVRLFFRGGTTPYYTLATTALCTKMGSTTTSGVVLGTRYP